MNALVRDKQGQLVHGLTKDDFVLRADGKPQTIRYFNTDSDLPLMLGLMVDTSGSMAVHAAEAQQASAAFLQAMMTQPQDRAFVLRFDTHILLLQKPTGEVPKLQSSFLLLSLDDTISDPNAKKGARPPSAPRHAIGGTLLFDAIDAAARQVVLKEPGRRALVVLTDGDDNGSKTSLEDTIHEAQLADVAVYSVLFLRDGAGPGMALSGPIAQGHALGNNGYNVMQRIAIETGGRAFVVSKEMPVERIYAAIEEDMRSQYRIGFTPPSGATKAFHTLELKTHDKHQTVQARTGYVSAE
jgi:VWFA-related protein